MKRYRLKPKVKLALKSLFIISVFFLGVAAGKLTEPKVVYAKEFDVITSAAKQLNTDVEVSKEVNQFLDKVDVIKEDIEETKEEIIEEIELTQNQSEALYSINDLEFHGVINWEGYKFTFYSERVLSGSGLSIPGRYTDDYVRDENGYIVLASNYDIEMGTIIDTPFGSKGKVYDRCPECTINWFDVYTR